MQQPSTHVMLHKSQSIPSHSAPVVFAMLLMFSRSERNAAG